MNLLIQRKIFFFYAIKREETAKIYMEFMKKDEIFIPRKFQEKNNPIEHRRTEKSQSKL